MIELHTIAQCNLWTAVYTETHARGKSKRQAEKNADAAVEAFTTRCPGVAVAKSAQDLFAAIDELRARLSKLERPSAKEQP